MSLLLDIIIDFLFSPFVQWPEIVTYIVVVGLAAVWAGMTWGAGAGYSTFFA